jgi:hypothetical protein
MSVFREEFFLSHSDSHIELDMINLSYLYLTFGSVGNDEMYSGIVEIVIIGSTFTSVI